MGLKTGAYIKVWEHKAGKGNYEEARISISKKNKMTGEYEEDFSGWVRCVGAAKEKIANADGSPRFKLEDFDVSNRYDPEKKITYWNVAIFNVSDIDGTNTAKATDAKTTAKKTAPIAAVEDSEDIPF